MQYIITKEQMEATLNYLANQPYKEVAPLINLLAKLTPYEDSNLETKTGDKGKSGK